MTDSDGKIFGALGIAVLEYRHSGEWAVQPGAPLWFTELAGELDGSAGSAAIDLLEVFPFLSVFLPDCEEFWESRRGGRLESDFWTQPDESGREYHLRASAVSAENKNWLLIEDAAEAHRERVVLQQYAHDQDLLSKRLDRATRAKSNFLATISHEIRTPLNAILGVADLLGSTLLTREQLEYVAVFQRAGGNLLSLLNDLLDLSKIEAGRLTIEAIPFDLRELAEDAVKALAMRAHSKGLELCLQLNPELGRDWIGDPHRLRQVLLNLLSNAVKFTSSGEVVLRVGPGAGQAIHFSVADTGIGIRKEKLRSIFDEFTQAESATTREYGGTGLGLSISKQLVEGMGGRIWAESEGTGSIFHIELSLAAAGMPKSPEEVELAGMRVLVQTASATHAEIVRELAIHWHAKQVVTAGGEQRFSGEEFDLAVIELPFLEAETGGNKQQFPARVTIPVIPSHNRIIDQPRAERLGLRDWLVKPIVPSELEALLKGRFHESAATAPAMVEPVSLPGLKILIADDSPDNRFLLKSYLQHTGAELVSVGDGAAAVTEFVSARFDLVLIDVQMPLLDGHSAVAKMREWERQRGRKPVPILMLTAGTLEMESPQAQASGASGLLIKPLRQKALLAAIEKHTSKRFVAVIDPEFKEIVPWYLEMRKRDLAEFSSALQSGDFGKVRTLGHNLRGTGGSYGFPRISEIGEGIEEAAKSANAAACQRHVAELAEYLEKVEWVVGR